MSQENVEVVRAWMEAWLRGDREQLAASIDSLDPEIEWDASRVAEVVPDLAGVFHGREGVQSFWRRWLSSWRDLTFKFDLRDAGEDVVLLVYDQRQWGRHSGAETEIPPYGFVFKFGTTGIVRATMYTAHAEALEAAGLQK
jgi:hypothetical protein